MGETKNHDILTAVGKKPGSQKKGGNTALTEPGMFRRRFAAGAVVASTGLAAFMGLDAPAVHHAGLTALDLIGFGSAGAAYASTLPRSGGVEVSGVELDGEDQEVSPRHERRVARGLLGTVSAAALTAGVAIGYVHVRSDATPKQSTSDDTGSSDAGDTDTAGDGSSDAAFTPLVCGETLSTSFPENAATVPNRTSQIVEILLGDGTKPPHFMGTGDYHLVADGVRGNAQTTAENDVTTRVGLSVHEYGPELCDWFQANGYLARLDPNTIPVLAKG